MEKLKFTSSAGNQYFYNDASGFIYPASGHVFPVQDKVFQGQVKAEKADIERYLAQNGCRQLLLEVTEKCNLRCEYCIYSSHYENTREHGCRNMPKETAFKAVDQYFASYERTSLHNPLREPAISFYGGEPLLNFQLIQEIVEYVKKSYPQLRVNYNVTTNGLLLTEEAARFLTEHNFAVIVSLDGDEENHDRNRKRADGQGSFGQVYANLCRFREQYPDYGKIGLSVCMDFQTDLEAVEEFFTQNHFFVVMLNMINDAETDYYRSFTKEDKALFFHRMEKLKKKYFSLAQKEGILLSDHSFLFALFGAGYVEMCFHSLLEEGRPYFMPCTGSCIPGEKVYVTVNGVYHMCERISPQFPIGNVETGLDYESIAKYVNAFNSFSEKCRECSVGRMCGICLARASAGNEIRLPEGYCEGRRAYICSQLKDYADLMEAGPKQMEKAIHACYMKLNSIAGDHC